MPRMNFGDPGSAEFQSSWFPTPVPGKAPDPWSAYSLEYFQDNPNTISVPGQGDVDVAELMQKAGVPYSFHLFGRNEPLSRSPKTFGGQLWDFVSNPAFLLAAGPIAGMLGGGAAAGAAGGAEGGTGITGVAGTGASASSPFATAAAGSGTAMGSGAFGSGITASAAPAASGLSAGLATGAQAAPAFGFSAADLGFGISPSFASGSLAPGAFSTEAINFGNAAGGGFGPTGGSPGGMTGGGGLQEYLRKLKELGLLGGGQGGTLSNIMNIGSGLYGMHLAGETRDLAAQAAAAADPFASQRPQYAAELAALRADPSKLTSLPGYKAGEQAVTRSMASQGYLGSGNMMLALQEYGGQIYDREVARLSELAGARLPPRPDIALSGNVAANELASRSLASLGYGVRGFF